MCTIHCHGADMHGKAAKEANTYCGSTGSRKGTYSEAQMTTTIWVVEITRSTKWYMVKMIDES